MVFSRVYFSGEGATEGNAATEKRKRSSFSLMIARVKGVRRVLNRAGIGKSAPPWGSGRGPRRARRAAGVLVMEASPAKMWLMNRPAAREGSIEPASGGASQVKGRRSPSVAGWILFGSLALGITGLDLGTKHYFFQVLDVRFGAMVEEGGVVRQRVLPHQPIVVIPGFFEIEANNNFGAFSGWFARHTEYLTALSVVALLVIVLIARGHLHGPGPRRLWFVAALGLLWGGTCGNLYDRATLGYVRDFVKWFFVSGGREHVWPNFNIADSAICVGVGIILCVFMKNPAPKPRRS